MDIATKIFHDTCCGKLPSDFFLLRHGEEKEPIVYCGIHIPIYSQIRRIPKTLVAELTLYAFEAISLLDTHPTTTITINNRIIDVLGSDMKYLRDNDCSEMAQAKKAYLMDLAERYFANLRSSRSGSISDKEKGYFENFFTTAKKKQGYFHNKPKDIKQYIEEFRRNRALTQAYVEAGMNFQNLPAAYYEKNADVYNVGMQFQDKIMSFYRNVPEEMYWETTRFLKYLQESLEIEFLRAVKKPRMKRIFR